MQIDIVNYIKQATQHGIGEAEIKQNLLNVGWEAQDVEDSFAYVKLPQTKQSPQPQLNPQNIVARPSASYPGPAFQPAQIVPTEIIVPPQTSQALPQLTLSEQHLVTGSEAPAEVPAAAPLKSKMPIIIGAVILALIVLGAGGYFAYSYFYPSPNKIWNNFLKSPKNSIVSSNFNFKYSDPGITDETGKLQAFSFTLNGTSYSNTASTTSPELRFDVNAGYNLPGDLAVSAQSGNMNFKIIFFSRTLYADLSSIPGLSQSAGQPISWIKLNFDDAQKLASSSPFTAGYTDKLEQQAQSQAKITKYLANILKNNQLVNQIKLLGSENINGVATYHLQSQIDKAALKTIFNTVFDDASASSTIIQQAEIGAAKQVISSIIDKITVVDFETWIGKKDSQLYKITLDLKFPGVAGLADDMTNPLGEARAKSRDAKRVADIRQMASALELYFNDHNGYPAGSNGIPQGINPIYIGVVPTAPSPSDGDCSNYYNTYWYTATGTPKTTNGLLVYPSYEYTFCLGSAAGTYKSGISKLTIDGIESGITCAGKPEDCHKQADVQQQASTQAAQAEFIMTVIYSDYGKKQTLTAPADALDVVKWIQDKMNSGMQSSGSPAAGPDSKRLSDIRQLASAQELYFNDKDAYPKTLKELSPIYIAVVPTAPEPPGSGCSEADNAYTYKYINKSSYQLNFCLGETVGGYAAGKHQLSQAGIQ